MNPDPPESEVDPHYSGAALFGQCYYSGGVHKTQGFPGAFRAPEYIEPPRFHNGFNLKCFNLKCIGNPRRVSRIGRPSPPDNVLFGHANWILKRRNSVYTIRGLHYSRNGFGFPRARIWFILFEGSTIRAVVLFGSAGLLGLQSWHTWSDSVVGMRAQ